MWLLNPKNITNFKADKSELELMILFWILAAGKNGVTTKPVSQNITKKNNK